MTEAHNTRMAQLETERAATLAKLNAEILDIRSRTLIDAEMRRADVIAIDMLGPHLEKIIRATADDPVNGEITLTVVGENGEPRLRADGSPSTVADAERDLDWPDDKRAREGIRCHTTDIRKNITSRRTVG